MQLPSTDRSASPSPSGTGLNSAAVSGVQQVRAASSATPSVTPAVSTENAAQKGVVRSPEIPSSPDSPNKDWTTVRKKETVEAPPEPPKEPIYKQLLEFLRSMWRASGAAVEIAQELNKPVENSWQQQRKSQLLTYEDLGKVKKTTHT